MRFSALVLPALCCLSLPLSSAFNLKHQTSFLPQSSEDDSNLSFGQTLAFYTSGDPQLLVGAPRSNSSQEGVSTPGSVYSCRLPDTDSPSSPSLCSRLDVDTSSKDDRYNPQIYKDYKDNQRLGASLAVFDEQVLVCAPNWTYETRNMYNKPTGALTGKCFHSTAGPEGPFSPFSPPFDIKDPDAILYYIDDGYCQAGLSATFSQQVSQSEDQVVLGAPGCTSWIGDVMVGQPSSKTYRRKKQSYTEADFVDGGSSSRRVTPYYRYLGYAVAVGRFNGKAAVVASSPRTEIIKELGAEPVQPSVSILLKDGGNDFSFWQQLYPPQDQKWLFSYCGSSVAVGDVNNDGLDDVVVGCPYHNQDRGAVLVYYQTRQNGGYQMSLESSKSAGDTAKSPLRFGENPKDRFGSSVTIIDDIDADGYKEVAVGAPFSNGGRGSVHIYCEGEGDLPAQPCQTLVPLETVSLQRGGYGWSVSSMTPPRGYGAAVAVGAPLTDSVIIYRSQPVLELDMSVSAPTELDINNLCYMSGDTDTKYPCVDIKVCVQYNLRNSRQETGYKRDFVTTVTLDTDKRDQSRLRFDDDDRTGDFHFSLPAGENSCQNIKVFQKISSVKIVDYKIKASVLFQPEATDTAVLDRNTEGLESSTVLRMKVVCESGEVETCRSDITVTMEQEGDFLYGTGAANLTVTVRNEGEPAYYSKLLVGTRGDLIQSGQVEVVGASSSCANSNNDNTYVECTFTGVGIMKKGTATFKLTLVPSEQLMGRQERATSPLSVDASFLTASHIIDQQAANQTLEVPVKLEPLVVVSRMSSPLQVDLTQENTGSSDLEKLGPSMNHVYEIENRNSYPLYGVSLTISWPYYHRDAEGYLLYIGSEPTVAVSSTRGVEQQSRNSARCIAQEGGYFDELQLNPENDVNMEADTSTGRKKRDVPPSGSASPAANLDSSIRHLVILCSVGTLPMLGSAEIAVSSFADETTFYKLSKQEQELQLISSTAVASVQHAPFLHPVGDVTATIQNNIIYKEMAIHWAWILLAVGIGLLVLLITILILYKCGVFKKKVEETDGVDGGEDEEEEAEEDVDEDGASNGEGGPGDKEEATESTAMNPC